MDEVSRSCSFSTMNAHALLDGLGVIIECSDSFAYLCGTTPKVLRGTEFLELVKFGSPSDAQDAVFKLNSLAVVSDVPWNFHAKMTHTGQQVQWSMSSAKRSGESVLNLCATESDMSERRSRGGSLGQEPSSSHSRSSSISSQSVLTVGIYELEPEGEHSFKRTPKHRVFHSKETALNVLLVDSHISNLISMSSQFAFAGHLVSTTCVWSEAVAMMKIKEFDIVMIAMGTREGMLAIEACQDIVSHIPHRHPAFVAAVDVHNSLSPMELSTCGFDTHILLPLSSAKISDMKDALSPSFSKSSSGSSRK
jgi:hypothetical protein